MKHFPFKYFIFLFLFISTFGSCKKYLAAKPDQSLALPETLNDLQLMLDFYSNINSGYPATGELSADNYYLTDEAFGSSNPNEQSYYLWQKYDNNEGDYELPFRTITTVNLILESIASVSVNSEKDKIKSKNIEGSALFIRAFANWQLAQNFCAPYLNSTANSGLGLPIRTSSIVLGKFPRSTVDETYKQIIADLKKSIPLLPDTADVKYHTSKAAAFGLLARTYLSMQKYENAGIYADSCLQLYSKLMDYNNDPNIDSANQTVPFRQRNTEVIFDATCRTTKSLAITRALVDTSLYLMYKPNDLRKSLYYQLNSASTGHYFKGNYTGLSSAAMFCGIATDEMILTRAECEARSNNLTAALIDINRLLKTRWVEGTFKPLDLSDGDTLLDTILTERRKELVFRGLRWTDLRRLNIEPRYQVTLHRKIGNKQYELLPGSLRYVFLFPHQSIELSGIQQNP